MAASVDKNSMDLRPDAGDCLVETENCKPEPDGPSVRKLMGRKGRILYDREFLIKCFHNPASTRKPNGFPIPHLDCTLAASKVKRLPLTATPGPAKPISKRKEDGVKRDRENDDNISLRPHSGNFPGGFGPPHPSSPSHNSSNSAFGRLPPHEDSSKGFDWDYHRNNFRFGNHRRDGVDRNRMDRDMDRDRDFRDRTNRDRLSGSNHRNSNSWSDGPDGSDGMVGWSRRRNGAHFPRDRDYNNMNRRYSNDRGRDSEEQEPEWFSGGPSSQHETIELRGFLDDDRRDKSEELQNGSEKENSEPGGENDSSGESTKNDNARESPMDLSIEKILKMDHIPGILTNDLLESEEPSGSSRFSQFFSRSSNVPDFGVNRKGHHGPPQETMYSNDEDKSKAVHEMGELLRNMLIRKNTQPEQPAEPKVIMEPSKPAATSKNDVDAFKKLMTPLLEKVLQGPSTSQKKPQPGRSPNMDEGQQGGSGGGNVLDIFKQPPQQKAHSSQGQEESTKNNPLQDIFNNMMNKSNSVAPPPQQNHGDAVPRLSAHQILQMIPPDLQQLVLTINVTQWDFIQLNNIAKNNEWTFRQVLETFVLRQCPPQQHMVFAGLLHLVIQGRLMLPGVIVTEFMQLNPPMPTPMSIPQPMPNHRPQNFEGPKDLSKRSATPVSSMAFTPTSVMRKMTADGNKSVPPPNPTGFVPVPISGGLLPTPPTTAPVMMNSNNPNLVSLMSTMGRPPMHMPFRPPPHPQMGYPPNPGFHPSMMPPNLHGPVMLPPPFQNIVPNQPPVFNNSKPEEN